MARKLQGDQQGEDNPRVVTCGGNTCGDGAASDDSSDIDCQANMFGNETSQNQNLTEHGLKKNSESSKRENNPMLPLPDTVVDESTPEQNVTKGSDSSASRKYREPLQSNWVNTWTLDEIKELQLQDPDIKSILDLKAKSDVKPDTKNCSSESSENFVSQVAKFRGTQ
jgi:hypothetical protein